MLLGDLPAGEGAADEPPDPPAGMAGAAEPALPPRPPLAVRGENERDRRGEQGEDPLVDPLGLLQVGHPREAFRKRFVEGFEVSAQLAELACDIGENLLPGPTGREHEREARVASLEKVEHELREEPRGRTPNVLCDRAAVPPRSFAPDQSDSRSPAHTSRRGSASNAGPSSGE